jgi:hypothetical protein
VHSSTKHLALRAMFRQSRLMSSAALLSLASLCSLGPVLAGLPTNVKLTTLNANSPEVKAYATEVATATAVLGLGVSVILGLLMFIGCIVCCCRCCRMRRRDLAVAEGSFAGDKAFPSSDYAYQDIEEHSRKHRKALWITTVMLFIGYVACAAAAYSGVLKVCASPCCCFCNCVVSSYNNHTLGTR